MRSRPELAQYAVAVKNEPGQLHKIAQTLADEGVNIQGLVSETMGQVGCVRFLAERSPRIRQAIEALGASVLEDPVLTVLLRNRPGELARLTGLLADMGINVKTAYASAADGENSRLVLAADQPEKARKLLAAYADASPLALAGRDF